MVRFHHRWVVYATTANTAGNWSLVEFDFARWSQAAAAPQHFLDENPAIGTGYRAAPQVFYFAPQHKWYLVYQTGLPSYSTSNDPLDPMSWSAPKNFLDSMPPIIADNIGNGFGSTCGSSATTSTATCSPPTTTGIYTGRRPPSPTSRTDSATRSSRCRTPTGSTSSRLATSTRSRVRVNTCWTSRSPAAPGARCPRRPPLRCAAASCLARRPAPRRAPGGARCR